MVLFVVLTYFLLRHNYVIYLLDVITFFGNVRITLYFGAFELRMEITIQLRFDFALRYFLSYHNYVIYLFDVVTFLMSSELCYILVRSNYVIKWSFFSYVCLQGKNDEKIRNYYVLWTMRARRNTQFRFVCWKPSWLTMHWRSTNTLI